MTHKKTSSGASKKARPSAANHPRPLVVDLDNSLLRIDVLAELSLRLAFQSPLQFLRLIINNRNLLTLKKEIASHFQVRPELLPLNPKVMKLVEDRLSGGSRVLIASATVPTIATPIASHLFIPEVLASDKVNLKGSAKLNVLTEKYGVAGYDYVGDAKADVSIWESANTAYFAGNARHLGRFSKMAGKPLIDVSTRFNLPSILRGLRPSHWVKNLLLAVPLVLAGDWDSSHFTPLLSAFLGFSFVASGLYLVNDLLDVDADRAHPTKRTRPIANGDLSAQHSIVLAALLVVTGAMISALGAGLLGLVLTVIYGASSLAYTLKIKTVPYLDILGLASLYVFRIVAGALVASIYVSYWMMLFALMTFSALASLKRITELSIDSGDDSGLHAVSRRGYVPSDLAAIRALGAGFTVSAIALLGIYAEETFTQDFEVFASLLLVISFASWLLRFWLDSSRGRLAHDPIKHALTDRYSLALLAITFGLYFWLSWSF
jgi:4-hydroxybenzoate polyprenyltransferase/phosphoserine phosphatase